MTLTPQTHTDADGAGRAAELLRSFDWAASPLGPRDGWPAALRTSVDICMNSRFPMFVWWGPGLINIYNDAYAPFLGQRHPTAFGRPAKEAWYEIWPQIEDDVNAVMRDGTPIYKERVRFVMERNGYPEVTYYTYSHSAIPDGNGGIGGLFQICSEETAEVLGEQREAFLRELDQLVRPLIIPAEITLTAATSLGRHLNVDRCAYADIEPDQDTMNITGNFLAGPEIKSIVGRLTFTDFGTEVLELMRADKPYVVDDVDTHRPPVGDPAAYRMTQIQAVICVPLHKNGKFVAAMAVHSRTPRRWMPDEVVLVQQVAARCWESIERARIERSLREAEERRRLALESAELGAWQIEPATKRLTVDARFRQIFGLPDCEVSYEQAVERIPPEDRERINRAVAEASRPDNPLPYSAEHRVILPDGTVRWIYARGRTNLRSSPIGGPLLTIDGTVADITERKATEARARTILESITDAFFAIDRQWNFTYVNPSAQRLLARDDLIGKIIWDEYPGLNGSEFERIYHRAMNQGVEGLATAFYPDHGRFYEVRVYPSPDGISVYFRDVSERERMLEADRRAREELEHASKMKDEFLATLSHELRTPLNAILGWSQLMKYSETRADIDQGLETIERNARAQGQIIEDLLDMSRIISGKVRLDVQRVDIASIVQAAVDSLLPTATAKGVRLQATIDPLHGVSVSGDPNRLQQIMWNLISNALKFTPRGGRVQVVLGRVNSHIEITVVDTGEGIERAFLPFVFDRFRQADASTTRRHGGLGLGLSIVKQLAELHGGSVQAYSDGAGQGSRFVVSLPLSAMREPDDESLDRRHPRSGVDLTTLEAAHTRIDGLRVLVVDDEADARSLLSRVLEAAGATVESAGSAMSALQCLAESKYDVLVSDIGMPDVDGYELIRRLRGTHGPNGTIPAIALTAYARAEDRVRAIAAGFRMHVAKPAEPVELVTMVASVAGRTGQ